MKKTVIALLASYSIAFGAADTSDTSRTHISCEELQLVIDSLKVKVDRLVIENKQDNNPLTTGTYKNWGTKFYTDIRLSLSEPDVTFGYSKRIGRLRYGTALGFTLSISDDSMLHNSFGYLKLSVSTPIFLNFMSFSGILRSGYGGSVDYETGFHIGAGIAMENWIARNVCVYLEAFHNDLIKSYSDEGVPPPKVAFGTRFYFGR
jgi:hypothetical protein